MTKEEYIEYAECRQASFTYKKSKKFREWLGFSEKYRPSDDIFEIIGFLLWEFLRKLTQDALLASRSRSSHSGSTHFFPEEVEELKRGGPFYALSEQVPLTPFFINKALENMKSLEIK